MSNYFEARGVLNLAEKAHRKGKIHYANNTKVAPEAPSLNANIFPKTDYEKLHWLSNKLILDCYALKSSKEVIRDFLIGLERIRSER